MKGTVPLCWRWHATPPRACLQLEGLRKTVLLKSGQGLSGASTHMLRRNALGCTVPPDHPVRHTQDLDLMFHRQHLAQIELRGSQFGGTSPGR